MLALLRTRLRVVRASGDRGIALAMVVGIASVLLLLISLTMTFAVSGLVRSSHDADWDAAMSAAYAGIAEYQGRLTNDPSYQQYGNPASGFTIANGSKGTVAMPPTSTQNPAFDVTAGGSWAKVPLSDNLPPNAAFRYEVDNSKYASNGVLHVRATGKVDDVTRSVVANIKQTGFTNYVYFTDYEELDPTLNSVSCPVAYAWSATTRPNNCLINFIAGDTFDGQVHSNDTLNICGGTFKQQVTTANPTRNSSGNLYSQSSCTGGAGTPTFSAGAPSNAALITMPPPQAQLDQVHNDMTAKVPNPGCLYTGPTKITFYTDSSGKGFMNVISPWTKFTQLGGSGTAATNKPDFCGKPGDPAKSASANNDTLSGSTGQNIPIGSTTQLYNNLVYVQGIPTASTDPNYWAATATPNANKFTCVGADAKSAGNGLGFPVSNEVVSSIAPYGCSAGDVFVEGTMHGAMTINAEHFAWITNKLVYQDSAHDILGLVGAGAVWVWNPVVCTNPTPYPPKSGGCTTSKLGLTFEAGSTSSTCARTVNAAILSNYHSFEVQNYDAGFPTGYLCVTGSIAQEFRGPVGQGTGSSGFLKRYSYDTRLLNAPPPKFPTPRTTSYDVTTEIEVKTGFTSKGAPLS